jgi:hypothetical protein
MRAETAVPLRSTTYLKAANLLYREHARESLDAQVSEPVPCGYICRQHDEHSTAVLALFDYQRSVGREREPESIGRHERCERNESRLRLHEPTALTPEVLALLPVA